MDSLFDEFKNHLDSPHTRSFFAGIARDGAVSFIWFDEGHRYHRGMDGKLLNYRAILTKYRVLPPN